MMKPITFSTPEEMLATIEKGQDLYAEDIGVYLFLYNECGSIARYFITNEQAHELEKQSEEDGEYWGSRRVVPGGRIFDSERYLEEHDREATEDTVLPIDLCKSLYRNKWFTCGPEPEEEVKDDI